jgi:hypothetical protein
MTSEETHPPRDRQEQLAVIQSAAREAVREALRRHMLLGESVVVANEDGSVRVLTPDEIREALHAA